MQLRVGAAYQSILSSVRKYPDSERAVEVNFTNHLQRAEKLDREFANVPATPRNIPQGPGPFVGKLSSFETYNVIPVVLRQFR
jgi:hypothetical protein